MKMFTPFYGEEQNDGGERPAAPSKPADDSGDNIDTLRDQMLQMQRQLDQLSKK